MDKELEDKIVRACPLLFKRIYGDPRETCMAWGIATGSGWFDLLMEASLAIEAEIRKMPLDQQESVEASQIKEKFGTLRFYMNGGTKEINEIISKAEAKSEITCEGCGKPGILGMSSGWLTTACGPKCGGKNWKPYKSNEK